VSHWTFNCWIRSERVPTILSIGHIKQLHPAHTHHNTTLTLGVQQFKQTRQQKYHNTTQHNTTQYNTMQHNTTLQATLYTATSHQTTQTLLNQHYTSYTTHHYTASCTRTHSLTHSLHVCLHVCLHVLPALAVLLYWPRFSTIAMSFSFTHLKQQQSRSDMMEGSLYYSGNNIVCEWVSEWVSREQQQSSSTKCVAATKYVNQN
jgi:hypothetical protein